MGNFNLFKIEELPTKKSDSFSKYSNFVF